MEPLFFRFTVPREARVSFAFNHPPHSQPDHNWHDHRYQQTRRHATASTHHVETVGCFRSAIATEGEKYDTDW